MLPIYMVWLVMDIIFREKYVKYNQMYNVTLLEINDYLIKNDISIELGDDFCNDWAGYSYYYGKKISEFDEITTNAFVYVITWFMTGNAIEINQNIKCSQYYKIDKIIKDCLDRYNQYSLDYDSEIDLCKLMFVDINLLFSQNSELYLKRTERLNCVLNYKDMELFNNIKGESISDKLKVLLDNYYSK